MDLSFSLPELRNPRHAALMLHAMNAADRTWLMSNLPGEEHHELQILLDELAALEISPDPALLAEVLSGSEQEAISLPSADDSSHVMPIRDTSDEDYLRELEDADVEGLVNAWLDEVPMFIARCLNLRPWAWTEQALKLLTPARRIQVRTAMSELQAAPDSGGRNLDEALMTILRRRCEENRLARTEVRVADEPSPSQQGATKIRSLLRQLFRPGP